MSKDSLSIATAEAIAFLRELGEEKLFREDEIEKILRASFQTLKRSEKQSEVLGDGILQIIQNASARLNAHEGGVIE